MKTHTKRSSCTSILVGKRASIDNSVIIGRNEDSKTAWPKHLKFYPAKNNNDNPKFVSKMNKFKMTLPKKSYQYSATPEWTDKYGVYEEDGINEKHVAMSATESAYANNRVLAVDPFKEDTGISEEAMVSVVLPYINTAREGVELLGKIVQEHGAAESDGILFADRDEAWYLEIGSGHHYVAQRIPDDSYGVVANQLSIQNVDFNSKDFITSPHLQDFVYNNDLWPKNKAFNWRRIFGTHNDSDIVYNTPRVWSGQRLLTPSVDQDPTSLDLPFIRKPDAPISAQDAQRVLSDHYQHTQYDLAKSTNKAMYRPISVAATQESHVLQIFDNKDIHWLAMGVAAQSVYIPFYPNGTKTPSMWASGKADYSRNSAYWIFKHAGTLVDRNWSKYGAMLLDTQQVTSDKLLQMRTEYDHKLATAKNKQELVDDANAKMAKVATDNYNVLISKLITKQTADSPLMFRMDPNL